MKVNDSAVATLRAMLVGDMDAYERLLDSLKTEEEQGGFFTLVTAAFFEAVDQKFAPPNNVAELPDIIEFIAYQRSAYPTVADQLDPNVAEQVIMHAIGKGTISDDVGGDALLGTKLLLLAALSNDADLDEARLDNFLTKARAEADEHLH
ncbi:hypothetical protein [Actinomadura meridiana]